jgi:hypothetical protein
MSVDRTFFPLIPAQAGIQLLGRRFGAAERMPSPSRRNES